jgi:hypothetical protein
MRPVVCAAGVVCVLALLRCGGDTGVGAAAGSAGVAGESSGGAHSAGVGGNSSGGTRSAGVGGNSSGGARSAGVGGKSTAGTGASAGTESAGNAGTSVATPTTAGQGGESDAGVGAGGAHAGAGAGGSHDRAQTAGAAGSAAGAAAGGSAKAWPPISVDQTDCACGSDFVCTRDDQCAPRCDEAGRCILWESERQAQWLYFEEETSTLYWWTAPPVDALGNPVGKGEAWQMRYPGGMATRRPVSPGPGLLRHGFRYYNGPSRLPADATDGTPEPLWPTTTLDGGYVIGDDAIYVLHESVDGDSPDTATVELCTVPFVAAGESWPDPFEDCVVLEQREWDSPAMDTLAYGADSVVSGRQFGSIIHVQGLSTGSPTVRVLVSGSSGGTEVDALQVEGDVVVRSYESSYRAYFDDRSITIGGPGPGEWELRDGWVYLLANVYSEGEQRQFVRFPAHLGQMPEELLTEEFASHTDGFCLGSVGIFLSYNSGSGSHIMHLPLAPPACDAEPACRPAGSCVGGVCVADD